MRAAGRHPAAGGSTRVPLGWLLLLAWLGSGVTIFLGEASRGGRPDQKGPWLQRRAGLETLTATAVGGGSGGARPGAFSVPTQQPAARPEHKFLMFFSGHQGSSALADMLGALPSVFIPGFEPLDSPGLTGPQKLAFLNATFAFPADAAAWPAWRQALLPPVDGLRVDRRQLPSWSQLAGKSVAGFKMRPYAFDGGGSSSGAGTSSSDGGSSSRTSRDASTTAGAAAPRLPHTAMAGLDREAVRQLLHRHNVSVLLTLRRNALKEVLSWHKARDLGQSQFTLLRSERAAAAQGAATGDGAGGQLQRGPGDGEGEGPPLRLRVDVPRVLHWLNYTARVGVEVVEAAAFFGRPTLTVWYEDFEADPAGQARRAAAFVGVPARDIQALHQSSKFRKAGPDDVEAWVANLAELCEALKATPYRAYLNATACALALSGGGSSSSGGGGPGPSVPPSARQLLDSWCVPADKEASGWGAISDAACMQRVEDGKAAGAAAVRAGTGTLLFKHVHKAGGSTLCQLAKENMAAESAPLPLKKEWDSNCVPFQAFLGPHPAAGRSLEAAWLGGACWLGFLTPAQLRAAPQHFRPLTFLAAEGPLPDALPLDFAGGQLALVTMLRRPEDRVLSSFRWWQFMRREMPHAPEECHAYSAPPNSTLAMWLEAYPDNWMTRELVGRSALYGWRRRLLTERDLETAQRRLHYFAAVLLLERPASSMALMWSVFGWRHIGWEERRAGSRHDSDAQAELDPELLERLRSRNQLDARLYEYAARLHEAQAAAAGGSGSPGEEG